MLRIRHIHVVIGGFTQRRDRMHGMMRLSEKLHDQIKTGPDVRIWYCRWCEPWKRYAEYVWILGSIVDEVEVSIYAYSWGAGWGAMQLAEHLGRAGISVKIMVLSDPVYRHPWPILRFAALLPGKRIKIPPKVRQVFSYYQRVNKPQGHELVTTSQRTLLHPPVELKCTHEKMDDTKYFHEMCLKQAGICA